MFYCFVLLDTLWAAGRTPIISVSMIEIPFTPPCLRFIHVLKKRQVQLNNYRPFGEFSHSLWWFCMIFSFSIFQFSDLFFASLWIFNYSFVNIRKLLRCNIYESDARYHIGWFSWHGSKSSTDSSTASFNTECVTFLDDLLKTDYP